MSRKAYLKAALIIITGFLLFITIYNALNVRIFIKLRNQTIAYFIYKNTGKKMVINADYNIILFVTPLDCSICSEYLLSGDFIWDLNEISNNKKKSFSISYVVSGDYTEYEKIAYISEVNSYVSIFIDKKNKANSFLLEKYGTSKTPFMLILIGTGEAKYWQIFEPDAKYLFKKTREKLYRLLEEIL